MTTDRVYTRLLSFLFLSTTLTACGGSGSDNSGAADGAAESSDGTADAIVTIGGEVHKFPNPECFTGFNNDLGAVLVNDKVHFEATQLDPAENTWVIKYNIPLGNRQFEEYSTRKHETKRSGNTITGTATAESGKLPHKSVDISYNITCGNI